MVDMENEEHAKKRLGRYYIPIWKGCDPTVSQSIKDFRERWKPYSTSSRRYPIGRLIQEVIDPAVAAYMATLPVRYSGYVLGAGTGVGVSAIIGLVGLDAMVRVQRQLLRQFIKTEDRQTPRDHRFTATLEVLIELPFRSTVSRLDRTDAVARKGFDRQR